ncbi:50S ribosomal protein L29 [Oenococcus oeni]|uniref:Large ribosomal subunit protein uL29 n=1 Tax=Oenococcus oeni TaxID=1247 RepID=A0A483BFN0_OENOE|nr:50S ribosomal protein L29 [Oenococcus oeni]KGO16274.1 50S ribosomal protein L29 [Oenococcus oeni X2L]AVI93811.1 50S ribosomal protein L29 [Oenococcus oeni]EJN99745.1 50S ribosomal protein L29P [Oenococcus oeni AWRIB418]EJO03778.1 50S ribosomal protein L29P [Oenococcus oeni AWRIB422]EJO06400.1 50S ribosomal protein L29P [Oenococcus oeni AWRIB548]
MKASEIKGLSRDDLLKREKDAKEELFNLRFQQAAGQLENTARLSTVKKDIARIKTELRAQEIAAEKAKA